MTEQITPESAGKTVDRSIPAELFQLSPEEKADLVTGHDLWHTQDFRPWDWVRSD